MTELAEKPEFFGLRWVKLNPEEPIPWDHDAATIVEDFAQAMADFKANNERGTPPTHVLLHPRAAFLMELDARIKRHEAAGRIPLKLRWCARRLEREYQAWIESIPMDDDDDDDDDDDQGDHDGSTE